MARAVELSKTSPEIKTFRVGCVIADVDGKEIASGFTGEKKGFHAEEIAIGKLAGQEERARGGTIFSTLEPCHPRKSGKTSCTDHILKLHMARVVYVLDEPALFVECKGAETLRAQGLEVVKMPEFEEEVREINHHLLKVLLKQKTSQ
jgi:pyrimidine deaminase RibD-like protein